jgi:hypothetical protein
MRLLLRALGLVVALTVASAACGGDRETTPADRAEPGDVTDAGAEGAFGEFDDCAELADEAAAAYERVVDELGDADRTDVETIDAALDSFGGLGPDLSVRADALDCTTEDMQVKVCAAVGALEGGGPAAQDFIDRALTGCGDV